MPVWIAFLLGIVQGLTEFLPISSSGHLALMQNLFKIEQYTANHIAFDIILHLGTLFAVIIAFWDDIVELVRSLIGLIVDKFHIKGHPGRRMLVLLIVATLPLVVAALLESKIEAMFQSPLLIGCALIFTAILLFFADRLGGGKKTARDASVKDALLVGLMQLLAVFPGVSRSGATMCGGLFAKFDRDFAVRFAFLLSIPAVLGATVFKLPDVLASGGEAFLPIVVGFFAAAISGYCAIALVKLLVKRNSFKYFSIYCACVGVLSIVLNLMK